MKSRTKKLLAKITSLISPKWYLNLSYLHNRGRFPNLNKPKDIAEIILSTMYSGKVNEYSDYVDKIKVRDFYTRIGYGEYLPKLYGIWDNPDDIDFEALPSSFALKTNHGCGNHYICKDKQHLNIDKAKKIIYHALNFKPSLTETQYNLIIPRVFCEEYIDDGTGCLPNDYKFMCLDSQIKCILIATERTTKDHKVATYDTKWKKIDYAVPRVKTEKNFPKPQNLDLMIDISNEISKLFEFVRVDFFEAKGKLYLGELTFTPAGGILHSFTNSAIKEMGRK